MVDLSASQSRVESMMKQTLLFLFTFSCFCGSGFAQALDRPNIVLVMADDQGYGDAGFTGHPTLKTPAMDAMARDGVVFNRFYSGAPVCSPTRASVMTGRNPVRVNVPNHGHYLRPQETTIAEALKTVGYVTGHFGKWHIGSVQKESLTSPGGAGFDEWLSGLNFFDIDPYLSRNGTFQQIKGQGSVISMDAALEFIEKHAGGEQPFLQVIWFPSPHGPHVEVPDPELGSVTPYQGKNSGYYREIQLLDQQLARLRGKLRELKVHENTLLWYTSDNGGLVTEHSGGREKKGSIYEGGLRVPSILEWPARFSPQSIDVPAFACDIYPTLLSINSVKIDNQPVLDGIDLMPILSGAQKTRPPMGFWHHFTGGQATYSDRVIKTLMEAQQAGKPNPLPQRLLKNVEQFPNHPPGTFTGHAAWNAWPWKLHRIAGDKTAQFELYHLENDPMETNDLAKQEPQRVERMLKDLDAWQNSVLESLNGKDYH